MIVEGKGAVAPALVNMVMTDHDMDLLAMEAKRRAEHRGYRNGTGWKAGLLSGRILPNGIKLESDEVPIFIGLSGEWAVQWSLHRSLPGIVEKVNLRLLSGSDGGKDVGCGDYSIQVKTCAHVHGENLVRADKAMGSDAFAFCHWHGSDIVSVRGWLHARDCFSRSPVRSARGAWMNYEIPCRDLNPFSELVDWMRATEGKKC